MKRLTNSSHGRTLMSNLMKYISRLFSACSSPLNLHGGEKESEQDVQVRSNIEQTSIKHPTLLSPSGDLGIRLVWHNLSPPHPTGPHRHFSVRLLKSSSNWTKLSMRGPQLFSGWYQMILGVFRCTQLFSDVFRLFSNCFPTTFSDCWNPLQAELNYLWWVLSCYQDDIRWF